MRTATEPATVSATVFDALAFEAPYVVERLVKDRVVGSVAEGEKLFNEAKRYLVLSEVHRDLVVGMYSVRVDEAWHAFILYTDQYSQFCRKYFGKYIGHAPTNAPGDDDLEHPKDLSFEEFREKYEDLFGEPLPDVWYNRRGVTTGQRVFSDWAASMTVQRHDSVAELLDDTGDIVVSVNELAHEALEFIATTGAFYVRELPGGLTDGEKVALVEALMAAGAIRLAP
ncbi:MAG TPA: hypothetical protein VHT50_34335 [Mycobacterium sp.]|jgi:hypothetical protein|nr:hypothetical protein [Mycobacterium sp.]